MTTAVCSPWATDADLSCHDADLDPAVVTKALSLASEVLFNLTGRAWPGSCTDTIRPVGRACWAMRGWVNAIAVDGVFSGYAMPGGWAPDPGLAYQGMWLSEIRLPGYPVTAVSEVKLDGVVLGVDRYRVDNRRTLVALPQAGDSWRGWPGHQRDALASDQLGTFEVTYTFGSAPTTGGVLMAAAYACELAMSMTPATAGQCRLPKRVTSITRGGISMAIIDPLTIVRDGMTGLPEVDMWVASVLLGRKRRRATITALDQHKPSRRNASTP